MVDTQIRLSHPNLCPVPGILSDIPDGLALHLYPRRVLGGTILRGMQCGGSVCIRNYGRNMITEWRLHKLFQFSLLPHSAVQVGS